MQNIELVQGDITTFRGDAIVNAANPALAPGAGVCGAIFDAANYALLLNEIRVLHPRGCHTGDAVITDGFKLPARHIIHAVGPVWNGGERAEDKLLSLAYNRALHVACDHHLRTIAFPAISTGVYGFPLPRAASIAITTVRAFQQKHPEMVVTFYAFDQPTFDVYNSYLTD